MTGLLISVTALLASVAILLLGHGLQLTLVPLYAVSLDWAPELIGYTGSSYFLGFVVGCLTVPRLVARVGHIRVFAVLIAAATAALLFIGLVDQFWFWMLSRAVSGWAFAGVYMVIESWLNEKTAVEHRGSVLSVYIIITLVSICIGQLLVGFELGFPGLFMLAAALLVLGVVPIGLTSSSLPGPIPVVQFRLARVVAASQVAMVGAFFGGLVTGGFWALGPVVASVNGLEKEQIGMFMAVTILGGTVFQYPVGRLSDRVDRRYVIAGLALLGVLTCLSAAVLLSYSPGCDLRHDVPFWWYDISTVFPVSGPRQRQYQFVLDGDRQRCADDEQCGFGVWPAYCGVFNWLHCTRHSSLFQPWPWRCCCAGPCIAFSFMRWRETISNPSSRSETPQLRLLN